MALGDPSWLLTESFSQLPWIHHLLWHPLDWHYQRTSRHWVLPAEPSWCHFCRRLAQKSNFDEDSQSANSEVTRNLATTMISTKCCLYLQWFEGKITSLILYFPLYSPLLSLTSSQRGLQSNHCWEIGLWLICLLQKQTGKHMQSPKQPPRNNLGCGIAVLNIVTQLESATYFSEICPMKTNTDSWGALPKPCGKPDSIMNDMTSWQSLLSTLPWVCGSDLSG